MAEEKIIEQIVRKAQVIAKILAKKSDVELRLAKDGVSVHSVDRKKVG